MATLLLLDEQSCSTTNGVSFHLSQATKHPANPLLHPGEPHQWDSLQVSWPGTVLYNARDRKFRCWYLGMDVVQTPGRRWLPGYAESEDGIRWTKPDLGKVDFLGKPSNRIMPEWDKNILSSVFENPLPDAPISQRFGSIWIETIFKTEGDYKTAGWCKSLAWSPDGIDWTRAATIYSERSREALQDISQIFYDPADLDPAFRWKAYGQLFVPRADGSGWPGIRNIGLAHGAEIDHLEDGRPPCVLAPEAGIDEELHFAAVQRVGETYLMLFESDRFSRNPIHGDLRLAVSADGRKFRRVHPRSSFVATGPHGMWDENMLATTTAGMCEVGDEVYIYYFGCPSLYNSWPAQYSVSAERRGSMFAPVAMGLATLPRDRYAYALAEDDDATITTHPLQLDAGELWLNVEGSDVRVATLDSADRTIGTGELWEEHRQTVYRNVRWHTPPAPGKSRVQIRLGSGTRLFSLQYR